MVATAAAQSAGTFQISTELPPTISEPSPCPPGIACENFIYVFVDRVGGTAGAVGVDVLPVGGTATFNQDYYLAGGRIIFRDGESQRKWIFVVPFADSIIEPAETVIVQLQNPTGGATIGTPNTATVTILDNTNISGVQTVPTLRPGILLLMAALLAAAGSVVLSRAR